ncbi:MAG TPA: adenylyltransferase/cytidyltransferase family protein [Candidatus Paceibacterota bacterium]|nr:adenylyltransferase/cytidyltransferase family protein [Candidatus Paceibacterota bacterium]
MKDTTTAKKPIIGFTASAFDLCHAGHALMLKEAKEHCDHLIVALQDDPSDTKDLEYRLKTGGKPKNTPIMSLEERRILLEANRYVDEIILYKTEEDLYELLQKLPIDVRFVGADWKGKEFTGCELPIPVFFNSRNHSYSTSELRERVYKAELTKREQAAVIAEQQKRSEAETVPGFVPGAKTI